MDKKVAKEDLNSEKEESPKKERKREDKLLRDFMIILGVILIGGFIGIFLLGKGGEETFEYRGVNFSVVTFCDAKPCLKTYNTKLPVVSKGEKADYNFWLRNDPRKLEGEIPFAGDLELGSEMDLSVTYGLTCEGYSSVAMDNFGTVFGVSGIKINELESPVCGSDQGHMYVTIQEGEVTSVEKTGDSCYTINIKECEILKGTERFLYEALVEVNKNL